MDERTYSLPAIIIAVVLFIAILVLAIVASISACSRPEKETLVVGTNTPFPPFETRYGEDVVGFDIDLAKHIALSLGRKLVVKDFSEFDALLPALRAGELDMVISAVTIRVDRDEIVDFSESYFSASQAVLTKKENSFNYAGRPNDFRSLKVGYQEGTTSEDWVRGNLIGRVDLKERVPFGDFAVGLQLLRLGALDAIILDMPVATSFTKSNADLKVAGAIETGEEYGVVVQEGDPQKLTARVNLVIATMKETGEYEKMIEKWFGGLAQ